MEMIDKAAVVSEIERLHKAHSGKYGCDEVGINLEYLEDFIDTLEVRDPYERCVQYQSVEDGIKAHAETYSFNIDSELFPQLTKEQQKLWRKEIEYACISGGDMGYSLAKDPRYKENHEVKDVDLEEEVANWWNDRYKGLNDDYKFGKYNGHYMENSTVISLAQHFFELGMAASNKAQKEEKV